MSSSTLDPSPRAAAASSPLASSLVALSAQCVKCGLCLPHCPTYRVMKVEGESPRGRIAFAQAIATGAASPTPLMRRQLDDCTACGSCEVVCPSRVRFDSLITETRALIDAPRDESSFGLYVRLGARLRGLAALARAFRWLPWPRISQALAAIAPRLARVLRLVPTLPTARAPAHTTPALGERSGTAILFRGCVASVADAGIHRATARLLAALGHEVIAPREQHCCGALDRHAGDLTRAADHATRASAIVRALATADAVVVGTATGCHRDIAMLAPPARFADVLTLLASHGARFAALPWRSQPLRAAWLAPCTQAPSGSADLIALATHIPDLIVDALPLQPRCCGAAGTYFVDHATISDALLDERIATIVAMRPDVVLTTNVGCRMHVQAGLNAAGLKIRVLHPVELFEEALP